MKPDIATYIAAALNSFAKTHEGGTIRGPRDALSGFANEACGFIVEESLVVKALAILEECKIATVSSDLYAGEFMKIDGRLVNAFVSNGQHDLMEVEALAETRAEGIETVLAEFESRPAFLLHKYSVFQTYREFGDDWLQKALRGIEVAITRGIPASDRIVEVDHNAAAAGEISSQFEELQRRLEADNDTGDLVDEQKSAALQEVSRLRDWWLASKIRVNSFIALARSTLGWISEKAASATVGDLSKRLLHLILEFFN